MRWCLSHRADSVAAAIADRHYNRQKIGSPQFVPPGGCLVLLSDCGRALWVTSTPFAEYVKHEWAGAWINSLFRKECAGTASDMIREALAASRFHLGEPPDLGLVTFIDRSKVPPIMVRNVPTWGYSYIKAGFKVVGETKGKLLALQIEPKDFPAAAAAQQRSLIGTALFGAVGA